MARPKKQPHEKRSDSLHADVTLAEKERVRDLVVASGLTEAEFIRRAVFGVTIQSPAPSRVDASLLTDLNRIGVNINQIARNTNSGRQLRQDADVVLAELRGVLEKVAAGYGA